MCIIPSHRGRGLGCTPRYSRNSRTNPILACLTTLALISSGLANINAGVFPLPDPRHSGGLLAVLGIGTFLLPILLPAALWKLREARLLKILFIVNWLAILVLIPIMSGLIQRISLKAG